MIRVLRHWPKIAGSITMKEYALYHDPQTARLGLMFGVDDHGQQWTLAGDVTIVRKVSRESGTHPAEVVKAADWYAIPGWPDQWKGADLVARLPINR